MKKSILTCHLGMSNDTYETHDQTDAPLGLQPFQVVAGDPWSILSKEIHWKKQRKKTIKNL